MKLRIMLAQSIFLWICTLLMLCMAMKPQMESLVRLVLLYSITKSWWWIPVFATIIFGAYKCFSNKSSRNAAILAGGLLLIQAHLLLGDYYSDVFDMHQYEHLMLKSAYSYCFAGFCLQSFIQSNIIPSF